MSDLIALAILSTVAAYIAVGASFAIVFVFRGIQRIDPAAEHSGLPFRVILIPGATALWPVLLRRWMRAEKKP
ncbi:MAG: hypothetical protein ACREJD_09250 [Phycisphaerales bacterium]